MSESSSFGHNDPKFEKFPIKKKFILRLVRAGEEAAEAALSPTYANSCTVLPNLADKCQILHFFGFFAHCYAHCALIILEAPIDENEILGNSMIRDLKCVVN